MTTREITSRDNPLLVRLRKMAQTPAGYRRQGQVWVEGDHLCRAALARGVTVPVAVATEAALADPALAGLLSAAAETTRSWSAPLPALRWQSQSPPPAGEEMA